MEPVITPGNAVAEQSTIQGHAAQDMLLLAVQWLCEHHGMTVSLAALQAGLPRSERLSPGLAVKALDQAGIGAGWVKRNIEDILPYLFPVVALSGDGRAFIVIARHGNGDEARYEVVFPEMGGGSVALDATSTKALYGGHALLAKPRPKLDERAGPALEPGKGHWLFTTLWRYRRYYYSAAVAAVLINVLTLASTFFTMNVYDRVVPNRAYETLWSLAVGVIVAMVFEFTARHVRAHLIDVAGKKADLVLGAMLFRKLLATRLEFRAQSAGSQANQFREFEQVRDFATSATIASISDLPFCLLFVGIIALIGGPLALVPLLLMPLVIILSIIIQWPLARCMRENQREGALKQGLLIEAISGIDSLKAAQGEGVMQRKWEDFSALSASSAMKSRALSTLAVNMVILVQQLQTVIVVVWGVYLIHAGQLSMGALVGTVILSGRAISPLATVVGLAIRFQQAKAALGSLDHLIAAPTERSPDRRYLAKRDFTGHVRLGKVNFSYPGQPGNTLPPALREVSVDIKAGERVAVLGNIGCGKSTLLRVMANLYQPTGGQVLLDGIDVKQIDPADVRTAVGLLGQDARLFYGTLRENVIIGRPSTTTEEFLQIARLTGLDAIAARHPHGFDMMVGEMGQALSGGQRQLVALARCLLLRPRILLMDEPTSSMDLQTERYFLERMAVATKGQTVVVATHRLSVLELVERVIVMDEGRIVLDGPKDAVLERLKTGTAAAQKPSPGNGAEPMDAGARTSGN
jgi:ATP-binding cassette, subfamily C, bacterial LapB